MSPNQNLLPVLTMLCLFTAVAGAQDRSKELTEAREAASLILNAASDEGVGGDLSHVQ